MIEYNIVFLYHLSSFKALLYARSSYGASVMISWQIFGVFQVSYPDSHLPTLYKSYYKNDSAVQWNGAIQFRTGHEGWISTLGAQ